MFRTTLLLVFLSFPKNHFLMEMEIQYEPWNPGHANTTDHMLCPNSCTRNEIKDAFTRTREDCCVCQAVPLWDVQTNTLKKVDLEYVSRGGKSLIVSDNHDNQSYFHLQHEKGFLSKLPKNICDFPKLVKIELMHNYITHISNISCLKMLDTLDLSGNKIKAIENYTFDGLSNLRVLKLAENGLKYLGPGTISMPSLQIFHVDFSHNDLEQMEISNMISENNFCTMDFTHNKVKELVNTNGFEINVTKKYVGGMVDLGGNIFTSFIDFEKLGVTDITVLGKVFSYGFEMTDMKWTCDCHMEPYLELAEEVLRNIWRDYFNITCWNPQEYRGRTIPDLIKDGHLDLFICNLTTEQKCPPKCSCFYQPKERRTVVNCTGAGLEKLPNFVPEGNNLTMLLSGNNIASFENREYLKTLSVLDLSNNNIKHISGEALNNLKSSIHLSLTNNTITDVPQEMQNFNPCKVNFGDVIKECTCGDTWLTDWVNNRRADQCSNASKIICNTEKGLIPASEITKDMLCKDEHLNVVLIVLSVLCGLLLLVSSFIYYFRFEIYILKRNNLSRKLNNQMAPRSKYDAFFSFNDENETLRMWVMEVLAKELEASGYRIFVPCRDLPIGVVREEELLENIVCSKHYIVVLCDYYIKGGSPWTGIEWKYIWHKFTDFLERKIIIVNFDQLDLENMTDLKLKAFLRLGYDIDFSNRKHELIQQIKEQLGEPLRSKHFNENRKPKFFSQNLIRHKYLLDDDKSCLFGEQLSLPGSVRGSEASLKSDKIVLKDDLEKDELNEENGFNDEFQRHVDDIKRPTFDKNKINSNTCTLKSTEESNNGSNGNFINIEDLCYENPIIHQTNTKPKLMRHTKSEATLSDIYII